MQGIALLLSSSEHIAIFDRSSAMSTPEFDIIFRGDIVFGHQLTDVKAKLQQLFKVDATKVDALFTGRPVPLKRNLDEATANKYRDVLLKAGAMVDVIPTDKTPPVAARPAPAPAPVQSVKAAPEKTPTPSAPKTTTVPQWSVAPAGTTLVAERKEEAPRAIDISGISLRPADGNLLDAKEMKAATTPSVIAPDLAVAEVGANLVNPDERASLPIVEFDIADWEIAEAGSDLLKPEEHPKVTPVVVDISQFNLAPAGSDLGQLKPAVKAVVPDISGISLADPKP